MRRNDLKKVSQSGGADLALIMAICTLLLSVGASFMYFSLFGSLTINSSKTLQKVADVTSPIQYYTADVRIQPEGNASTSAIITGTVSFDVKNKSGSGSFSFPLTPGKITPRLEVETLFFPDSSFVKFHLNDINGVSSLKFPEDWMQISNTESGLEQFEILQKSLALSEVFEVFREGGGYLIIDGNVEKQLGGDVPVLHFALRHSQVETSHPKDVSPAFDTILKEGKLNVWVGTKDKSVREVRFAVHGYLVTMKIKDANKSVVAQKPGTFLSSSEWKTKQFSGFSLKEPVSEIFIGSYGAINKEYLEAIRSSVEKATGVKTTTLLSGPALPERPPLYDLTRRQLDAIPVFESVKGASDKYGAKSRFIYVLDTDLYSSLDKSLNSVWYIDRIGTNTALMSLSCLRKTSDTDISPTSQPIVIARAQKVALHILGTSVGFGLSPSSEDPSCLMHKTSSLAELDAERTGYCPAENAVIKNFFKK